jgi:saccharopine dehydrogenase (NAD+, L-lysine-forming)
LLVAATGYAGNTLASYLLKETGATVILAGRSRAKLDDLQSGLRQQGLAHRLEVLELDATNLDSAALGDFDLLVNATAEGPHNAALIQACLDHRADWIDMQMNNELLNPPPVLRDSIERAGRCFVIQAGFHPGIIAPLIRYAGQQMDVMVGAIVGSVIRDKTGLPYTSGFSELVASFRDYKSEMYKDGQWQKLKYSNYPKIRFEYGFGELLTYPVEMTELRRLTELMPDLRNTGFFIAGFNWFADYLITPLIMLSSRIAPRQTEAPLGRLLSWSTKRFSRPPYGTVVQVDAEGRRDGQPVRFRLSLFHEDAYVLTAVPTVAMIKQMLSGKVQPGIHLMGLCCDPVQLIEDIERTDVSISQRLKNCR